MRYITSEVPLLKDCALDLFVAEQIGRGAYRSVYGVKHDPTLVLKIEYCGGSFHNITEWNVWEAVKDTPVSDWFAPCIEIDAWGSALFQRKVEVFETEKEFRDAVNMTRGGVIPSMFDDIRFNNFGLLDGRVVCMDYGLNHAFKRMGREMMIEAGYLVPDPPSPYDYTDEGQMTLGF